MKFYESYIFVLRYFFLRFLMYYLLDVNNVGVRMKERRHTPHAFPRRRGRRGARYLYTQGRKEGKISASPPTTLELFLSP